MAERVAPFAGARTAKPTKKHRPVVWEAMLGTVYAMDPTGTVRYFDYDVAAAHRWAGVTEDRAALDLRVSRWTPAHDMFRWHNGRAAATQPHVSQWVLWSL